VSALDGLYRHHDYTLIWDDVGVTISRPRQATTSHVGWNRVSGARQIGGSPGFIQLLVQDHVPPADPAEDPFSISVASDDDARRLVTNMAWRRTPSPLPRQSRTWFGRRNRRSA
jgi:hypothetical protein